MHGFKVLHPMGFDAFGLPAENAAIRHGIHPQKWTMDNIDNMRRQLKTIGAIYPRIGKFITCDPDYYKWTQWFFIKLFEKGLAYYGKARLTGALSVMSSSPTSRSGQGRCWRCESDVVKRDLAQWLISITKYADALLDFTGTDWPERIKPCRSTDRQELRHGSILCP